MKLIVSGSRTITNPDRVKTEILAIHALVPISEIVAGAARGVDTLAANVAREAGIPLREFPADWNTHGRSAGFRRNETMARYVLATDPTGGALLALWDGASVGTKGMIDLARRLRIPTLIACIT